MVVSNNILDSLYLKAKECYEMGDIPVAAAIIDKNGNIVSLCGNSRHLNHSVIDHAEINCIVAAEKVINDWRLDSYSLVVSLAPCNMCLEVILESRIDNVFYILDRNSSSFNYISSDIVSKLDVDAFYIDNFRNLLTSFFDNLRH